MKVVVTGGGTGGHVYPALAIISALATLSRAVDEGHVADVLYVGSRHGMERDIVQREGLRFAGIEAGPLRGKSIVETAVNIGRLGVGLVESLRLLGRQKPNTILATGGYVCVPVVVAGWLQGVPSVIYLPDVRPGWAIRFLSRFAKVVATTSGKSSAYLPAGKVVETGYPVRPEIGRDDKAVARQRLGLGKDLPVVLALGGSRGAHSINVAIGKALSELLAVCQLVHVCGQEEEPWLREMRETLGEEMKERYHLYPYLHSELPYALAAADLAISRSGASVMGEYPAAGLPSILVPYPYAGGHQRLNAQELSEAGAAILLENERLEELATVARSLLMDSQRLSEMARRARGLSRPEAAQRLARILAQLSATGRADL